MCVQKALTLRWLLATSRVPSNLLACSPFLPCCPRAVVGANAWRERVYSASLVLAAVAPLCCAREPRRTILRSTTFLFSSGGKSPKISMQTLILIIHFPKETLDEKYKKLYSLKADHSPPRRTKEGARQRERLRRKILVLGIPRYQRLPQLLRGPGRSLFAPGTSANRSFAPKLGLSFRQVAVKSLGPRCAIGVWRHIAL